MAKGFIQVDERESAEVVDHPSASPSRDNALAAQALTLILKGLSAKALVAISSLFTAGGLLSAWLLWRSVLADPSTNQLIAVSLYAVFLLAVEVVRRR